MGVETSIDSLLPQVDWSLRAVSRAQGDRILFLRKAAIMADNIGPAPGWDI